MVIDNVSNHIKSKYVYEDIAYDVEKDLLHQMMNSIDHY